MKQLLVDHTPFHIAKMTLSESKDVVAGRMRIRGKLQESGVKNGNGRVYPPEVLKKQVKNIKFIAPRIVAGVFGSAGGSIVRGTKTGTYSVYGEYPEYIKIATSKIYDGGRFINQSDIKDDRKVCVIGERTQLELFEEDEDPIGKFISINKINFRVVGVHKFVQGGGFGDDGDIYIPFTTFKKIFTLKPRLQVQGI